jgi:predicted enzyme related to lactoylglutathione lyase
MTHDTKAAAAFYNDVIGWDAQEHQMPRGDDGWG